MLQKHLDPFRSLSKQEILKTITHIIVHKYLSIELFSSECLFIEIAKQVYYSLQLKFIRDSLLKEDKLLHLLIVDPLDKFLDLCVCVCDAVGDDFMPFFV